jgi:hypothetical protein
MKRGTLALAALAALAVSASASATAAVPSTLGFTARLVDDKTDKALTGTHHITFELFDAETAGRSVWQEGRDVTVDAGLLFTDIGETKPLDATVFDGRKLWLEVKLDDATMEPRIAMDSVPYAIHAGDADTLGGMATDDLQTRITGSCGAGNFIIGVNADGTVVCAPDLSGSGDITAVTVGPGLMGGGPAGDVNIALTNTCAPTEVLKWNGTAWNCAADANSGGDITGITIGPAGGITGGGTSGDITLALLGTCGFGQVLKWNGGTWICGNDLDTDTNSGGDITGISVGASSGLVGGGAAGDVALSLLTNCGLGQLLKWNGSAWGCANDTDTDTNSGGDITDVVAGNGLVGGGSTGAVTVDVAVGTGLLVTANQVALDQAFTDARYVNATGDTMSGALDMAQQRVVNRGCPAGYVRHGPGLCAEDADTSGLTFSGCANKCRVAGTHLCSSAEMRGIMQSGVAITNGVVLDWIDDQDAANSAFFINSSTDVELVQTRATTTASFCRCCANVE